MCAGLTVGVGDGVGEGCPCSPSAGDALGLADSLSEAEGEADALTEAEGCGLAEAVAEETGFCAVWGRDLARLGSFSLSHCATSRGASTGPRKAYGSR